MEQEMTEKQAYKLFEGLDLTKEELLQLLSMTLVNGGLTDTQIREIVADWRYLKDQMRVSRTH
jgi:hypothetical protein